MKISTVVRWKKTNIHCF